MGYSAAPFHHLGVGLHRGLIPPPRVLERLDLSSGASAVLVGKEDVEVAGAVEGRVEVDQVNRFVLDVTLEHVEVVAVVEEALGHSADATESARHHRSCGRAAIRRLAEPTGPVESLPGA